MVAPCNGLATSGARTVPGRPCGSGLEGRVGKRQRPTTPTATVRSGTATGKPGADGGSWPRRPPLGRAPDWCCTGGAIVKERPDFSAPAGSVGPAHRGRRSGRPTSSSALVIRVSVGPRFERGAPGARTISGARSCRTPRARRWCVVRIGCCVSGQAVAGTVRRWAWKTAASNGALSRSTAKRIGTSRRARITQLSVPLRPAARKRRYSLR